MRFKETSEGALGEIPPQVVCFCKKENKCKTVQSDLQFYFP